MELICSTRAQVTTSKAEEMANGDKGGVDGVKRNNVLINQAWDQIHVVRRSAQSHTA
jgi:hypothetical protein